MLVKCFIWDLEQNQPEGMVIPGEVLEQDRKGGRVEGGQPRRDAADSVHLEGQRLDGALQLVDERRVRLQATCALTLQPSMASLRYGRQPPQELKKGQNSLRLTEFL